MVAALPLITTNPIPFYYHGRRPFTRSHARIPAAAATGRLPPSSCAEGSPTQRALKRNTTSCSLFSQAAPGHPPASLRAGLCRSTTAHPARAHDEAIRARPWPCGQGALLVEDTKPLSQARAAQGMGMVELCLSRTRREAVRHRHRVRHRPQGAQDLFRVPLSSGRRLVRRGI